MYRLMILLISISIAASQRNGNTKGGYSSVVYGATNQAMMDGMPIFLQLACHQWDAICLRIGIDGIDGRQICLRATSALKIIELEQILIMYII